MLPRRPRNMHREAASSSSASESSSRSSPMAAPKRRPRLKHCARSRSPKSKETDVPASVLIFFLIVAGLPVIGGISFSAFGRWLQHKERMSKMIADQTAEKAAQYAAHVERIEARVRVLEQIATDGGVQTAAQIEALRDQARIPAEDQAQ